MMMIHGTTLSYKHEVNRLSGVLEWFRTVTPGSVCFTLQVLLLQASLPSATNDCAEDKEFRSRECAFREKPIC
jgi:hypothetical protein